MNHPYVWVVVIALLVVLLYKKWGSTIRAYASPQNGSLPAISWKGMTFIVLSLLVVGIGVAFLMGKLEVPGGLPGTEWLIHRNGYLVLGVFLVVLYALSHYLGAKSGKALRFVIVAVALYAYGPLVVQNYWDHEARENLQASSRRSVNNTPLVCGVPNPRPEEREYDAPGPDSGWDTSTEFHTPKSGRYGCTVRPSFNHAMYKQFDMQCRPTQWSEWVTTDPYGNGTNCNYMRLLGKKGPLRILWNYTEG